MLLKLKPIFIRVLQVDENEVNEKSSMENLMAWDSMNHLELITQIEDEFKIKFSMQEIMRLNNMAQILATLKEKGLS